VSTSPDGRVLVPDLELSTGNWKVAVGPTNRTIKAYADAGFTVVGLAGEAETDIAGFPGIDGPVLVVVGSEGDGLARLVRENCDVLVHIPIGSGVESLNASVAASIALYEITRARA
jgi:23S rRNA (guanosine2251-2'-O)-methyltransferase